MLLQVAHRSRVAQYPEAISGFVGLGQHDRSGATLDDGSQVSVPGPALSLEDARRFLGPQDPLVLGQGDGNISAALRDKLASLAVVYVSGRKDFDAALREAVLQYTPMGDIYKTPGKIVGNFLQALEYSVKTFPNASWYYISDDDSFVHLERLAHFTSSLDPKDNLFVGHHDCKDDRCGWLNVKCQREEMDTGRHRNPGWVCGGPGVLLSQSLAKSMASRNCGEYYSKTPAPVDAGDIVLACCAYDVWEGFQVQNTPYFLVSNFTKGLKPDEPVIAVHKITPETTRELGKLYNAQLPKP